MIDDGEIWNCSCCHRTIRSDAAGSLVCLRMADIHFSSRFSGLVINSEERIRCRMTLKVRIEFLGLNVLTFLFLVTFTALSFSWILPFSLARSCNWRFQSLSQPLSTSKLKFAVFATVVNHRHRSFPSSSLISSSPFLPFRSFPFSSFFDAFSLLASWPWKIFHFVVLFLTIHLSRFLVISYPSKQFSQFLSSVLNAPHFSLIFSAYLFSAVWRLLKKKKKLYFSIFYYFLNEVIAPP